MQLNLETSNTFEEQLSTVVANVLEKQLGKLSDTKNDSFPPYMNKKQAAKYLGVSFNTFDTWATQAKVPFRRIGNVKRYKRSDLDSFTLTHSK